MREKSCRTASQERRLNVIVSACKSGSAVARQEKITGEPLFPSYVFVRLHENEVANVSQTDGVSNFLFWLGKPAIIRNEEVEEIKGNS